MSLAASILVIAACSASDGVPLGGPYGGVTTPPPPTAEQTAEPTEPTDPQSSESAASGATSGESVTWSKIYSTYLASGTEGRCADCHRSMRTASGAYAWLVGQRQIPGLADPDVSCLSWLGGNMPPRGPRSDSAAAADLAAWAAAGGAND
jgi:hypothetical protein